tara:strand:- start:554 stop:748 length:195 start_codon:yes stop_codon:yes gene_type:complete
MSVIDQELAVVREVALLEVHPGEVVVVREEAVVRKKKEEARQKVMHQQALKNFLKHKGIIKEIK